MIRFRTAFLALAGALALVAVCSACSYDAPSSSDTCPATPQAEFLRSYAYGSPCRPFVWSSNSGKCLVYLGDDNGIVYVDSKGNISQLYKFPAGMGIAGMACQFGKDRVLIAQAEQYTTLNTELLCMDMGGTVLWNTTVEGPTTLLCCDDHWLCGTRDIAYEIGLDGEEIARYPFPGATYSICGKDADSLYFNHYSVDFATGTVTEYLVQTDFTGAILFEKELDDSSRDCKVTWEGSNNEFMDSVSWNEASNTLVVYRYDGRFSIDVLFSTSLPNRSIKPTAATGLGDKLYVFSMTQDENARYSKPLILTLDQNGQLLDEEELELPAGEYVFYAQSAGDNEFRLFCAKEDAPSSIEVYHFSLN